MRVHIQQLAAVIYGDKSEFHYHSRIAEINHLEKII